jgi:protein TonB
VPSYRGSADRPDQAKAIAAVVAIHAALAFVILSGLDVRSVQQAVDRMTTIAIEQPPPPPPVQPPKPAPKPEAMKKPEGAAARKAEPTPVVAPQPKLPLPSPVPAAKVAGQGTSTQAGAALAGNGTGAGGSGTGLGGDGTSDYSRFTPAQKITKIPNQAYRRLVLVSGMERGTVGLAVRVTSEGIASNCRVVRSSGNPVADSLMCQLTEQYVRFRPARDPYGRAVAQDVTWYPNWWRP